MIADYTMEPFYPPKKGYDEKHRRKQTLEAFRRIGINHKKALDARLEEMCKNGEL